jgi:hypothetical protein
MMLRAVAAVLALLLCAGARADFSFALLGDTPYGPDEEATFTTMLREIDHEALAFVVHVGDFKSGWTSCSDAVFDQRRALFDGAQHPFVYVAGDNEWTDCSRLLAGGYDPLERLAALRTRFFSGPRSLGRRSLGLTRQSDTTGAPAFPEHLRWQHDGVVFVALNMPGGSNNLRMPEESAVRTAAALDWLQQAFALARAQNAAGVVVLMQANPFLRSQQARRGYESLLEVLARETAAFAGAVLLGHGDTHVHRVDQPLRHPQDGKPLANFTRAEVHGSPEVNWLRVRVTLRGARAQFSISAGR